MHPRLKKMASLVAVVAFLPTQSRAAQEHTRPGQDAYAGFQTSHITGQEYFSGVALFKDPLTQEVVASPYQVALVGNKFVGFNAWLSEGLKGEPVTAHAGLARQFDWKHVGKVSFGAGLTGLLDGGKFRAEYGASYEKGKLSFKVYYNPSQNQTISSAVFKQALKNGKFFVADAKFDRSTGEKGGSVSLGTKRGFQLDAGMVGGDGSKPRFTFSAGKSHQNRKGWYVEGYGGMTRQGKDLRGKLGMAFIAPPKSAPTSGSPRKGFRAPRNALGRRRFTPRRH